MNHVHSLIGGAYPRGHALVFHPGLPSSPKYPPIPLHHHHHHTHTTSHLPTQPQASFFRKNLHLSVVEKLYGVDEDGRPQPISALVDYVTSHGAVATGIVYCLSRDESEHVSG